VSLIRQQNAHIQQNTNLTFIGPCIVKYSYNKCQKDALFLKFILVTCSGKGDNWYMYFIIYLHYVGVLKT